MIFSYTPSATDFFRLAPEIALLGGALLILLADLVLPERAKELLVPLALAAVAVSAAADVYVLTQGTEKPVFLGMLASDHMVLFTSLTILAALALGIIFSATYVTKFASGHDAEYYALLLLAGFGMTVMAAGMHLAIIFLGLEILSVALYVLSAFSAGSRSAQEAGIKYLLLSSFASGFLLYGIALLFGATSTGDLPTIRAFLSEHVIQPTTGMGPILLASIALLTVGFAFKVSAVPFQAWTPDVYVGAPTPVTAFMSVGTKVAAFAAFARVFVFALHPLASTWLPIVWALAIITMVAGNLLAVSQSNVKRLLAYSSVANAGYMLIAIAIGTQAGVAALLVYLATYAAMNVGAFGALAIIERQGGRGHTLDDLAGLSQRQPFVAACFAILLMGLTGIPLLSGFIGKFAVFLAAVRAGHVELALIGALASLLGFYYYLRVIWAMYFTPAPTVAMPVAAPAPVPATGSAVALAERPELAAIRATIETGDEMRLSFSGRLGLILSVAATLALGILPFLISGEAVTAAAALFPAATGR